MSIADSKNAVEMEVLSSDPVPPKKTKFPRLAQIVTEQAMTKQGGGSVGWPATDTVATLFCCFYDTQRKPRHILAEHVLGISTAQTPFAFMFG